MSAELDDIVKDLLERFVEVGLPLRDALATKKCSTELSSEEQEDLDRLDDILDALEPPPVGLSEDVKRIMASVRDRWDLDRQTLVKLGSTTFRCKCGSNLFFNHRDDKMLHRCCSCSERYLGEELP